MKSLFLSIFLTLLTVGVVNADGNKAIRGIYNGNGGYNGHYGYNNNVIKDRHIQNDQFNINNKLNVVDNVDVLQKRVEFDANYFLGVDGYFSVANGLYGQYQNNQSQEVFVRQSQQIDQLIGLLQQVLKGQNVQIPNGNGHTNGNGHNGNGAANGHTNGNGKSEVPVPNIPNNGVGTTNLSDELNFAVFNIFQDNCASCHGADSPRAGFQVIAEDKEGNDGLVDLSLAQRINVFDLVAGINLQERGKKLMPLGGPPLPDEEVEILRLWAVAKAEQEK